MRDFVSHSMRRYRMPLAGMRSELGWRVSTRRRAQCMLGLFAMLLCAALLPNAPSARAEDAPIDQMRAVWVDSANPGVKTPAEINELVSNVVRANANTIFVQMRRHGDALYTQSFEPHSASLRIPADQFDPLAALLDAAHAQGIKVHAWIVVSVACPSSEPTRLNPQHVCYEHGPSKPDPIRWTTATYRGAQSGELDFGHPDAVNYMVRVVENLVSSYPNLDGIHYDFFRYADVDYGYNAISLARFRAAYGRPEGSRPAPTDPQWSQWRRDRMTELARRLYIRIKAINPQVQVSAATITWGGIGSYNENDWTNSAAYSRVFQDWRSWLQEGILDFAVPMHYFADSNAQQRGWYDSWIAWDRWNTGRRAIIAGTGAWLNNDAQGISQIQRAFVPDEQGRALSGVALYSYNQPLGGSSTERRRQYMDQLRQTVFSTPARAPEWPWIVNPTTGHIQGIAQIDGQPIPNAKVTLFKEGEWVRDITAQVDGWYGSVDLGVGHYTVRVEEPGTGRVAEINTDIRAGQVTSAE